MKPDSVRQGKISFQKAPPRCLRRRLPRHATRKAIITVTGESHNTLTVQHTGLQSAEGFTERKTVEAENDQTAQRMEKLEAMRAAGRDPYGPKWERTGQLREIRRRFEAEPDETAEVRAAGRLAARRGHGKSTFFDIHDGTAKLQANATLDRLGEEAYADFKDLDLGDIVGVTGTLGRTRTGEMTVWAAKVELLAKSLRPLPEKFHGLKDVEQRHRMRYLDLIANPEVGEVFRARSAVVSRMRRMLEEKGFMEVETPMMQAIPGGAAARPFITRHNTLGMDLYLRVAPELSLKRLLVGGLDKVFEINRNFRNEGISPRHNPEFTMLELYEAYADLRDMMALTEEVTSKLAVECTGAMKIDYGGRALDFTPPWPRIEYMEAVGKATGADPGDEGELRARARGFGIEEKGLTYAALLDEYWGALVEPEIEGPVFVVKHPVEMSPLCRAHPDNDGTADRFEVIAAGMEIANAYSELNDPLEQKRRFEEQAEKHVKLRREALERGEDAPELTTDDLIDGDFLHSLEYGMPPAGGLGIGIDRLVMLLTGQANIREVILFPLLRPQAEE
ncbi:MAG: lysine--tRNA ligase [Planctomycetes bacterium]|nr:lysine--tRNA ligase [Planctomycetota bacterium]